MKLRLMGAVGAYVSTFSSMAVQAATLDFSNSTDLGVGTYNMIWQDNGNQHLTHMDPTLNSQFSFENLFDGSYDVDTYVHSLNINMLSGPTDPNAGGYASLRINVWAVDPDSAWQTDLYGSSVLTTFDIDLHNYSSWDSWLTLDIDQAHVWGIQIIAPYGNPFYNEIYPSFDNLVVTQTELTTSAVPVPAAAWLFGSGLLGLVGVARRKKVA